MKIIQLHAHEMNPIPNLAICLGFFDGVHIAHQRLLELTIQTGKNEHLQTAVMTFSTHILSFLKNETFMALTTNEDKIRIAEKYGFDYFFLLEVTPEFIGLSPEAFIQQFLSKCKKIIVGYDYTFGHKGAGNAATLLKIKPNATVVVPEMDFYRKKIGSSRIRNLLLLGKITLVNRLLGRKYQISGVIIHGKGRGRSLGYPTANIDFNGYFLPRPGVYYTSVYLFDQKYPAMTNIGDNPTFEDQIITLETHIFGIDQALYGEHIRIEFEEYIRPEWKFLSKTELTSQMRKDEKAVQKLIETRR